MRAAGIVLLFIVGVAVSVAAFIFATWIVVWNVNDIIAVGANFWNVFWILLVGVCLFGGSAKAAS